MEKARKPGDEEPMTETLEIQVSSRALLDRTPSTPAGEGALEDEASGEHTELLIVEGQIMGPKTSEETCQDIQKSNEEICLKIENALNNKPR